MTRALIVFASLFWEICIFRKGPRDVPAVSALMWISLFGYAIAGLIILSFDFVPIDSIIAATTDAAFLLLSTAVLLTLFRHPERTRQTVSAMAGCGIIISLIAVPVAAWLSHGEANNLDITVPGLIWLGLFGWNVLISSRILQQALSVNLITALATTLTMVFINQKLINLLLPSANGG